LASILTGQVYCSSCGRDCTALYGLTFIVPEHRMRLNHKVVEATNELDRKYGKHDFVFCLECCIKNLGVKPLELKQPSISEVVDKEIDNFEKEITNASVK